MVITLRFLFIDLLAQLTAFDHAHRHTCVQACATRVGVQEEMASTYCLLSPDYSVPRTVRIDLTLTMIRYRFCVNGYRQRISPGTYWITTS